MPMSRPRFALAGVSVSNKLEPSLPKMIPYSRSRSGRFVWQVVASSASTSSVRQAAARGAAASAAEAGFATSVTLSFADHSR